MKLPDIQLVKPKIWDLSGAIILLVAILVAGANLAAAFGGDDIGAISTATTGIFATIHIVVCLLAFMVLGKTAEMGTIWGNLLTLAAGFLGMSGVLLSSTLWALS